MSWIDNFGNLDTHPVLMETNFTFPGQINMYRGKVRDMYLLENGLVIMITTDRLSAFDRILTRGIPYKGRILSEISVASQKLLDTYDGEQLLSNVVYNTSQQLLLGTQVIISKYADPIPIEMVVRAYLSGHAAREYKEGKRLICGVRLPEGLKENDPLPRPIITPTLKGLKGQHDEDITPEDIIDRGIVDQYQYREMEKFALGLFELAANNATKSQLILVDAKYEFGIYNSSIVLIDEIHTPDSARFFDARNYHERHKKGLAQRHLSKEFVRQWLIEQNFQGKEGQTMPEMTDDIVIRTSQLYIELYQRIFKRKFLFENVNVSQPIEERIYDNVVSYLKILHNNKFNSLTKIL